MVWYQYVWEATTGNEAHLSDDENDQDTSPLSFEDWELQYNDVLRMMWNTTRTLLHDAHITYSGDINDFSRFCYIEHDPLSHGVCSEYEDRLLHVWKNIRRIVDANGLHGEFMRGATFWNFMRFSKDILCVK
tara:strand:- start:27 stop:422 length:396 start_codon:yes stop_codon:yes gene_type:complete